MFGGDVTRAAMTRVAKTGEPAMPLDLRKRLGLASPLGAALDDASLAEIEAAHCGMMPKDALRPMAFAQRYRDANIADVLLHAAEKHGRTVLFAGNGHVRSDRGVPWYVRLRAPEKRVIAVMLVEVEEGRDDPAEYLPRDPDGRAAADILVFTPSKKRGDPCAAFAKPKPGSG
jgi:hypothetical protein